ncbi:MAG: endonuclease/exonuclease/phosphatase family protein [bacterium]|nr:endonuclease/exonuclease/phosphatase family protein [bacterium]
MKRLILLSYLLFSGIYFANSQEITVATFNAEFLNKSRVHLKFGKSFDITKESKKEQKFWNDDENRSAKLKEASTIVAKHLQQLNADIMTLTEVGGEEDIKILVEELEKLGVTYDHWEVCDCTDSFTGQHVAVLSKFPLKEVWPQIPGRALYLEEPDGDSEGETGISKGFKVTVTVENKDIDVFVLHLISERKGFESDAKRLAQANIARRAIIKQLNEGREVIVAGDFNSEKRSESVYRLRGFDDVFEELIQTGLSRYFESNDVRWTYNFRGEPEQIDHILISPGLSSSKGIKTRIIETTDDQVSDHNAVVVSLNLK